MRWQRVNDYLLMIEPGIEVYLTPKLEQTLDETAIQQLVNASGLPGVYKVLALPDVHAGYGLPVGGVMATRSRDGVISPGAVGVDINCGVRLLATDLEAAAVTKKETRDRLLAAFRREIPAGEGKNGVLTLAERDFRRLLQEGPGLWWNRAGVNRDSGLRKKKGRCRGGTGSADSWNTGGSNRFPGFRESLYELQVVEESCPGGGVYFPPLPRPGDGDDSLRLPADGERYRFALCEESLPPGYE